MQGFESLSGIVEAVEAYGIYLSTDKGRVIVLITDLRKEPVAHPDELFAVGDSVQVRLIRFITEKNLYKGSLVPDPFNE